MDRRTFLAVAIAAPALGPAARALAQTRQKPPQKKPTPPAPAARGGVAWTQWGGPRRNFQTEASGLRDTWPDAGPRVIWKRALGEGYSSVITEGTALYTLYAK